MYSDSGTGCAAVVMAPVSLPASMVLLGRRQFSALTRGVGGPRVMASGIARLLQQTRDMGTPDNANLADYGAQLMLGMTEAEAYFVQECFLELGDPVTSKHVGWKVGATAAGPQAALKLDGPFRAPLFARNLHVQTLEDEPSAGVLASAPFEPSRPRTDGTRRQL